MTDRRLFCILHACTQGITKSRLIHVMYMLQQSPIESDFRFKFNTGGLYSRDLDSYISELTRAGIVYLGDSEVSLTPNGVSLYHSTVISMQEWDCIDSILVSARALTDEELGFICLSDMIVQDTLKRGGAQALMTEKSRICEILGVLSSVFNPENFDYALKIFKHIRSSES